MARVGPRVLIAALLVAVAGCSGAPVDAEASPATIPQPAIESHDYVHQNTTDVPLTYRVGGLVPVVSATTWAASYIKPTAGAEPALLLIYSSPNEAVAGQSVNPLGQLSNRELVGFVLERVTDLQGIGSFAAVRELRERGAATITILGNPTQLVTYAGIAEIDGQATAIVVNVAAVEHEGDVVVALGVYHEGAAKRSVQAALVRRIEHAGGR